MVSAGGAGAGVPWGLAQGCGGCVHTRRQPRDTRHRHLLYLSATGAHTAFSSTEAVAPAGRPRLLSGQWPHSRSRLQAPHHGGPGTRLRQPCNEKSPVTGRAGPGSAPPALSRGSSPAAPGLDRAPSAVRPWPPAPALGPASVQRPAPPSPRGPPVFSLWDPLSSAVHNNTGGRAAAGPGPGDPRAPAPPCCPGQPGALGGLGSAGRVKAGPRGQPGTATTPCHPQARAIRPHAGLCHLAVLLPTPYRPAPPPPWRPGPGLTSQPP